LLLANDGLYFVDGQHKPQKHSYLNDVPLKCGISVQGQLILGTTGKGLFICSGGKVTQKLLGNVTINEIYNFHDSLLFCASTEGLVCLKKSKNDYVPYYNYTQSNGLASDISTGVTVLGSDLYVSNKKGITKLPLKTPSDVNEQLGTIYLNHLKWNGEEVSKTYDLTKTNRRENRVSIDFGSQYYSSYPELTYHYKLLPDGEEIQVPNGQFTLYSIGVGKHQIQLIAKLPYTEVQSRVLTLTIKPRWFESRWFILFLILLGSFIWYTLAKKREKKKHSRELQVLKNELKTQVIGWSLYVLR
jgi:hypothetical protein